MKLEGQRIRAVRGMQQKEVRALGWEDASDHQRPAVIELTSGEVLIPSRDPEGNGPGALYSLDNDGTAYIHTPKPESESDE